MTYKEQEAHYATLRTAHPGWSVRFRSGYVAGANDEGSRTQPNPSFTRGHDEYALGYLTGFAVYRGPDAEIEPWFGFVGKLVEEAIGHQAP